MVYSEFLYTTYYKYTMAALLYSDIFESMKIESVKIKSVFFFNCLIHRESQ